MFAERGRYHTDPCPVSRTTTGDCVQTVSGTRWPREFYAGVPDCLDGESVLLSIEKERGGLTGRRAIERLWENQGSHLPSHNSNQRRLPETLRHHWIIYSGREEIS